MMNIGADEFEEQVQKAQGVVLVDFWAEWCGPCKAISTSLEEIDKRRSDIRIVKVDAERNRPLAAELNVRTIPTLILFSDGEAVATHVGTASASTIETWIDASLAPSDVK